MSRRPLLPASAIALLAVMGGCLEARLTQPSPDQVARLQARWPSVTSLRLEDGRTLCSAHCASCHAPPNPREYTADAWPSEVAKMARRAHLNSTQAEDITRYLQAVAEP